MRIGKGEWRMLAGEIEAGIRNALAEPDSSSQLRQRYAGVLPPFFVIDEKEFPERAAKRAIRHICNRLGGKVGKEASSVSTGR